MKGGIFRFSRSCQLTFPSPATHARLDHEEAHWWLLRSEASLAPLSYCSRVPGLSLHAGMAKCQVYSSFSVNHYPPRSRHLLSELQAPRPAPAIHPGFHRSFHPQASLLFLGPLTRLGSCCKLTMKIQRNVAFLTCFAFLLEVH